MNPLDEFERFRPLKDVTTFGIGGPADYFIEVRGIPAMQKLLPLCKRHELPYMILGKGSNLLFSDQGFAYGNDVSFLQEGIIDSIGVMELVTFAGATFGVVVDPQEVTPENFDSVSKLANYIRRKQSVPA